MHESGLAYFPRRGQRTRSWVLRHVPQFVLLRPYELFISMLCLISGIPLVGGAPAPSSIEALLPPFLVRLWGFELLLGALLVAYGLVRPRTIWERVGHTLLGPAAVVYGLAIVTVLGMKGIVAAAITGSFGLAAITRAYVLHMADQLIREVAEEAHSPWPGEE